jgi:hypothetical protein
MDESMTLDSTEIKWIIHQIPGDWRGDVSFASPYYWTVCVNIMDIVYSIKPAGQEGIGKTLC